MINALFAVDQYGGMGFNGTLPWPHNSVDLANFKQLTDTHIVVMGRKTWDDPKMPKPLVGRTVYVATGRP
jgi:dihydrofolate reductase